MSFQAKKKCRERAGIEVKKNFSIWRKNKMISDSLKNSCRAVNCRRAVLTGTKKWKMMFWSMVFASWRVGIVTGRRLANSTIYMGRINSIH